jgi:preprotein translocase subunit YajC
MLLIASAFAQDVAPSAVPSVASSGLMSFLPLLLIFGVFYFMLIRPQMKKQKEHQAMINSIARGEKVVTGGGIIGTVVKVEEDGSDIVQVEIATDVRVRVKKSSITEILSRTQPVKQDNNPAKETPKEAQKEARK